MIENLKKTLDDGVLRYKDDEVFIDIEKGEQCDHYDVFMITPQGMVLGMHVKTIEALATLPFKFEKFAFIQHPEGKVVGMVSLD